jgi:hypothetical protein
MKQRFPFIFPIHLIIALVLFPFAMVAGIPDAWNQNTSYSSGDTVIEGGTTYLALVNVPAGTTISSTSYWTSMETFASGLNNPGSPPAESPNPTEVASLAVPPPGPTGGGPSDINASGLPNATGEQFVRQQYYDFLGREPDAGGLAYWAGLLDAGTVTRAQVTAQYVFSDEYQNNVGSVARLYYAYLGRLPDAGGFEYWVGVRLAGASLNDISATFATSAEFESKYGSLDDAAFIDLIYQNVLGRTTEQLAQEAEGRAFWTSQLAASTRGAIMVSFSESAEYKSNMDSEVQIIGFYYGMLRRFADQGGFDYWVSVLDTGIKPYDLIDTFLNSAEYQGRFPALN